MQIFFLSALMLKKKKKNVFYIQYGWYLRKIRLYGSLAGSAGLLLNWSGWNIGTENDEGLLNWFNLTGEQW